MIYVTNLIYYLVALLLLLLPSVALAVPVDDLVDGKLLPGWNKATPSKWYSGFLNVSISKKLHYIFVEAEAPLAAKSAPVILWLNGGPGCSSLEGFFYEHGPVVVADAHAPANINFDGSPSTATNVSSLIENRWSWSKVANVIYLEAPAGVGFSYSKVKSDLITGDNQTAADNLIALELFFKDKFPEYATNPFYVSGESYGGVYVPTLSLKIYQSGKLPQMRGYLVGNGVFDEEESIDTHVPFAYGHGFLSTASYNEIMKTCKGNYKNPTPECKTLLKEIDDNMVDVNGYDAYRTCYHPDVSVQQTAAHPYRIGSMTEMTRTSMMGMAQNLHVLSSLKKVTAGESVPCINSVLGTKFLNKESVRTALHVEQSPNQWQVCGGVEYKDDGVYKSLISVHKKMLAKYQPRVLVYNGDVDPGCNYLWAEASVQKFGLNVSKEWHPWVYGDRIVGEQLGGFMTEYTPNVSFVTVHGAGHMSPQWRPEAVFHMLSSFLN